MPRLIQRLLCAVGLHLWWPNEPNRKYFTIWRDGFPDYLWRLCIGCQREDTILIERPINEEDRCDTS